MTDYKASKRIVGTSAERVISIIKDAQATTNTSSSGTTLTNSSFTVANRIT